MILNWTQKGLTLHHPRFGVIRVNVRNGCPQVAEANALKLIAELEAKRLVKYEARIQELQAKLDSMRDDDWVAPLLRFTETGQRDQLMVSIGECASWRRNQDRPCGVWLRPLSRRQRPDGST